MSREYIVHKFFNHEGKTYSSSERRVFDTLDDMKPALVQEYAEYYKDDPEFIRVKIQALPQGDIDFELGERMTAIREMCELGNKVRATTKIRNRQPLRHAYVSFANRDVQEYMTYLDRGDYSEMIMDELNVLEVKFMDDDFEAKVFDYNIKPNFRALGPKGYGKQAQALKIFIQAMGVEERNNLYLSASPPNWRCQKPYPITTTDAGPGWKSAAPRFRPS